MRAGYLVVSAVILAAVAGCRGQTSEDPPIIPLRNMYDQPKYMMQGPGDFYQDGRSMRPVPANVVARDQEVDPRIAHGRIEDNSGYVLLIPQETIDRYGGMDKMLARGQERYGIYCTPCHGLTGAGDGMAVKRGFQPPPTYHQDQFRHMPDGQVYAIVENGLRNMPAYAAQTTVQDRWAIVAYVRALQVSQAQVAAAPEKTP
jgi:mono/diheme cytochrome c family protein